jgi:hypothetical protein
MKAKDVAERKKANALIAEFRTQLAATKANTKVDTKANIVTEPAPSDLLMPTLGELPPEQSMSTTKEPEVSA